MKYRATAILTLIGMFFLGYFKTTISETISLEFYNTTFSIVTIICIICWASGFAEHDREMARKGKDPFTYKDIIEKENN